MQRTFWLTASAETDARRPRNSSRLRESRAVRARGHRQCRVSPRPEPREAQAGSGAGGHVGGQDVVRVAVKVLTGPVVAHRGPRVGVAGSDLDVPQVDAGVELVVTNLWRSMCGCGLVIRIPAAPASRRRRRVAAWRSIRMPRLLSRIGPPGRDPPVQALHRVALAGRVPPGQVAAGSMCLTPPSRPPVRDEAAARLLGRPAGWRCAGVADGGTCRPGRECPCCCG